MRIEDRGKGEREEEGVLAVPQLYAKSFRKSDGCFITDRSLPFCPSLFPSFSFYGTTTLDQRSGELVCWLIRVEFANEEFIPLLNFHETSIALSVSQKFFISANIRVCFYHICNHVTLNIFYRGKFWRCKYFWKCFFTVRLENRKIFSRKILSPPICLLRWEDKNSVSSYRCQHIDKRFHARRLFSRIYLVAQING